MKTSPITHVAGVKIPEQLPRWCPQFLAHFAAAYEDGRWDFDTASEKLRDMSEAVDLAALDPKARDMAGLDDTFLDAGHNILRHLMPVFGRQKIAAAIAPHIQAGKARGHVIIAAYRAANGGMDADQVERIVTEEIAALTARENQLVAA
jgi:hypothetical protein